MGIPRISFILFGVMVLVESIHGASFPSNKNSSLSDDLGPPSIPTSKNSSPSAPLDDLQTSASDAVNVVGVSSSVSSGTPLPGYAAPVPATGYSLPPAPAPVPTPAQPIPPFGGLGGLGGLPLGGLPFLPGFGGNFGLDVSGGGYFPIVEKAIIVIGGGILLLVLLAIIQGSLLKGGMLNKFGRGFFHDDIIPTGSVGVQASANASVQKNAQLTNNVLAGVDKKF
jgi:hypothetical protein